MTTLATWLGELFTGADTAVANLLGLGTSSAWYTSGGLEAKTCVVTYSATNTIHIAGTFTNTSGSEKLIEKVGLWNNNGTPDLLGTYTFPAGYLKNFGYLPDGESITVTADIVLAGGTTAQISYAGGAVMVIYGITSTVTFTASIDPNGFTPISPICYNGIELPNAGITNIDEYLGAKAWDFICSTDDYSIINTLNRYAGPVSTGASITGHQYVISPYRSGTLAIKDIGAITFTKYDNCYIAGPLQVEPFGDGYFFNVRIVQSYFAEV